jgi:5,10-methylene-tetrahydrofolate dehydrogenase/methenyl tetrahydrofolate cyclohydrolase
MTPSLLDPIRPYLALVRVCLYALLAAFLFVGGCNHGKGRSAKKVDDLTAQIQACESANRANMDAISALTVANEAYARQSAKQAEAVAQAVKDAKRAQERAEKDLAKAKKELANAYKDHPVWASEPVPSDIKRLLDPAR